MSKNIDELCIDTIRILAADMVERAKSGHPGMPLGASPMAYVLYDKIMKYNPANPRWFNRDRFILSAGHGSAMLYAILHLYGFGISMEELKSFRQWGSITPGHPEYNPDLGIEATTGPLGQGFGMGVGIAIAEKYLADCMNIAGFNVVDHFTYAIVSDGDLMEGVSYEAASLAGHLKLGKLIYLYDDNHISIEGETDLAFTEDVRCRFEAYKWHVAKVKDGNNIKEIENKIKEAQKQKEKPSLIIVRTHIGYGSPKQDKKEAHGEPLGEEALKEAKKFFGFPENKSFYVPEEVYEHCRRKIREGREKEKTWLKLFSEYKKAYPELGEELESIMKGRLPENWEKSIEDAISSIKKERVKSIATREASGRVMNSVARALRHFLIGGAADLAPSTKSTLIGYGDFGLGKYCANNLHFGVREHAMGAIINGIALHSNLIPYAATFLIFSDYMRPAIRLSALMNLHVIFIFTHDSIGLGEDGPTHQPVEQLSSLRAIPNLTVIRPCDANETAIAWKIAIKRKSPVAIALTRQKLPVLDINRYPLREAEKGGYIIDEAKEENPDLIIIATGSEVHLALKAKNELEKKGIKTRVVSMPCMEIFEEQNDEYKSRILPEHVPKIAIEAGVKMSWYKYTGCKGAVIGIERFGSSAPGNIVMEKFGFSVDNVIREAVAFLKK